MRIVDYAVDYRYQMSADTDNEPAHWKLTVPQVDFASAADSHGCSPLPSQGLEVVFVELLVDTRAGIRAVEVFVVSQIVYPVADIGIRLLRGNCDCAHNAVTMLACPAAAVVVDKFHSWVTFETVKKWRVKVTHTDTLAP